MWHPKVMLSTKAGVAGVLSRAWGDHSYPWLPDVLHKGTRACGGPSRHRSLLVLLGSSPAFLIPSHSFQEQSVDPGVCRLVGTNRHIKDSWFPSSCLGQCLPETAVGLEHLAPLFMCLPDAHTLKAEGALCRWARDRGLSQEHFSTSGHCVTPPVKA